MNNDSLQANKYLVRRFWQCLDSADQTSGTALNPMLDPGVTWFGHQPVGELRGAEEFVSAFWNPLRRAFPDLRRDTHLFFGGTSNGRVDGNAALDGRHWVTGTGLMRGTFRHSYLGVPPTGQPVSIRWGEFCRIESSRIVEIYFLLDMIDLMQQAGVSPLPRARGRDRLYPPPARGDGVLLEPQDPRESAHSLEHIRQFIFGGLNRYDQSDLKSMGMARFFRPDVRWYGPGGIGACLSLREFEDFHQRPWLKAFPDRRVQDLTALIAEGPYSGGPGWAGVKAHHVGPYLGSAATGLAVSINGLDWWKRDGDMYVENWVFVDMIHLFRQFGVELMDGLHG
jgi:predicted ester cyclase